MSNPDINPGRYNFDAAPSNGQWVRVGDYLVFARSGQRDIPRDPSQRVVDEILVDNPDDQILRDNPDEQILQDNPDKKILIPNQDRTTSATEYQIPDRETFNIRNNQNSLTRKISPDDYLSFFSK